MISQETIERLGRIVGPKGLRVGDGLAALDPGIEKRNLDAGVAVLPASTEEVVAVVKLAREQRIPLVTLGGRTGLAGAGVSKPGELLVLMNRMNRILAIDAAAATAIVEPGVVLSALAAAAAPHGLTPAIDLGARDSCTVGGLMGTNAGGMEAHRHGPMRRRVLGLEAVMPDGRVLSDLKEIIKNNEGYDIKQLLIGAEGTLGIVTRAVLKLEPDPGERAASLCFVRDADAAVDILQRLRRIGGGAILTRAEIMWRSYVDFTARANKLDHLCVPAGAGAGVIFETASHEPGAARAALEDALGAMLEDGEKLGLVDVLLPKNERETRDIWHIREDWAVTRAFVDQLGYDVSVPLRRIEGYIRELTESIPRIGKGLGLYVIGHLGDGNLHVMVTSDHPVPEHSDAVAHIVLGGLHAIGGSLSAEHGIGLGKRAALARYGDPVKLALIRAVKTALDPDGLMNPGKVVV